MHGKLNTMYGKQRDRRFPRGNQFRDRRQHDIANFFLSVDLIAHINWYCCDAAFWRRERAREMSPHNSFPFLFEIGSQRMAHYNNSGNDGSAKKMRVSSENWLVWYMVARFQKFALYKSMRNCLPNATFCVIFITFDNLIKRRIFWSRSRSLSLSCSSSMSFSGEMSYGTRMVSYNYPMVASAHSTLCR